MLYNQIMNGKMLIDTHYISHQRDDQIKMYSRLGGPNSGNIFQKWLYRNLMLDLNIHADIAHFHFRCNILTCTVFHYPTGAFQYQPPSPWVTQYTINDVLRNPEVYTKGYSPQNVTPVLSLGFASH